MTGRDCYADGCTEEATSTVTLFSSRGEPQEARDCCEEHAAKAVDGFDERYPGGQPVYMVTEIEDPVGQLLARSNDPGRPFAELMDSGLLWLINASVFHPRGLALAIALDPDGNAAGWQLLAADAGEAYRYAVPRELDDPTKAVDVDDLFRRATATMEQARLTAWGA